MLQRYDMLWSHPADTIQIQRVAAPTPHNGIPLKRFYTVPAIVKKSTRKSITFGHQPPTTTLLCCAAL
jgi:hypothetical protein